MKSIIFLTTPTSATDSIWRILQALYGRKYKMIKLTDQYYLEGRLSELKDAVPPEEDTIIHFNTPQHFNKALDLSRYNFIINARDPRDLLCNQYHWMLQHPVPKITEEELQRRREKVSSKGIDAYALQNSVAAYYDSIRNVVAKLDPQSMSFCTYAAICLDFEGFLGRVSRFLTEPITEQQRAVLDQESPEQIRNNKAWCGNRFTGADTRPGRYKTELKPETIEALNALHVENLQMLREHDLPSVRSTYDE